MTASAKVAVAKWRAVRHRHGPPEPVMAWFNDARAKHTAIGCAFVSDRWDVAELNKIIYIEGYLVTFLERSGRSHRRS